MSTYQFLQRFISDNRQIPELSQIYHHVYFKSLEYKYLSANDSMLRFAGLNDYSQFEECTDSDLLKNYPLVLNQVLNNDKTVVKSESTKVFYETSSVETKNVNFLSVKAPLYDENQLIGLCGISFTPDNFNLSDFNTITTKITNLLQNDWSADTQENLFAETTQPKLTSRELECLYFYMRGHSTKHIAGVLGLSNRTIEFYVDNIKAKFGVHKRSDLVPLAFNLYPELL